MLASREEYKSIFERNIAWEGNKIIPSWVDTENVGLDQFFTHRNVAESCYHSLLNFLSHEKIDIENCHFVEPSAGNGSFFNLLPKK